jgi:hypothetical protein
MALIDVFNNGQKIHVSAQAYGDSQPLVLVPYLGAVSSNFGTGADCPD